MSNVAINKEEKIFTDFEKLSIKRKKEVADFIACLKAKEEVDGKLGPMGSA